MEDRQGEEKRGAQGAAVLRGGPTGPLAWLGLVLTCIEVVCGCFQIMSSRCADHFLWPVDFVEEAAPHPLPHCHREAPCCQCSHPPGHPHQLLSIPGLSTGHHWARSLGQLPSPGLAASQAWGCTRTCAHGGCGVRLCVCRCVSLSLTCGGPGDLGRCMSVCMVHMLVCVAE